MRLRPRDQSPLDEEAKDFGGVRVVVKYDHFLSWWTVYTDPPWWKIWEGSKRLSSSTNRDKAIADARRVIEMGGIKEKMWL